MNHRELVREITQELHSDKSVLALMLYGSVSRNEENAHSDVDFLVIVDEKHCQKRHVVRSGITIEYLEMHIEYLQDFIDKDEIPILFTLIEGIILFDKASILERFITQARSIIDRGPPINEKWKNVRYITKQRSDITEIYNDLLDTEDEIVFHYLITVFITAIIPLLNENYHLWPKTRKKTMQYLQSQCCEAYQCIEILLSLQFSLTDKRSAAKSLIEYALKQHGGILEGDAVIFKF